MGWRFVWTLLIEHNGEPSPIHPWIKWATIGLAVVGIAAVIVYRTFN